MDEAEVQDYIRHAQSIVDDAPQMDEANTKAAVLRDLLDLPSFCEEWFALCANPTK